MQKIVFYIGSLARGGAQRVLVTLANALAREGISCVVVTSYKVCNEYNLDNDVKRIVLIENPQNKFFRDNITQVAGLRKILKKEAPDSVVSFMGEPNIRMLLSSIGLRCKKIISVRNDPSCEYPNFIYRFFARTFFRLANHIVFQTGDAQCWFPKVIQRKSSIILNPVSDVFFKTNYAGNRRDIVSVGRLVPQKNHEMTIRAFAKVANLTKDNLIIYGDGPLKKELQNLVLNLNLSGRVFFPGNEKNIHEKIKSSKLFVLSAYYECLPNSLMEAIALGLPCVSTDCPCGGPKMLLNSDFLIKINDNQKLSQFMLKNDGGNFFDNNYRIKTESFQEKNVIKEWIKVIL